MVEYYEIPAILTPLSTWDHNVMNWKSKCNIAEKGNLTKIKVRQFHQQQLEQFDALLANYRAVARTLIGGVYIHIFRFCPTSFF